MFIGFLGRFIFIFKLFLEFHFCFDLSWNTFYNHILVYLFLVATIHLKNILLL